MESWHLCQQKIPTREDTRSAEAAGPQHAAPVSIMGNCILLLVVAGG